LAPTSMTNRPCPRSWPSRACPNSDRDVGHVKGLPFERPYHVLVGLVGEGSKIGEREN